MGIKKRLARYIPPTKPYGFRAMLHNLLDFAVITLVDQGRLCFWMPTADDEGEEHTCSNDHDVSNVDAFEIPTHPSLELLSVCVQPFNKCGAGNLPSLYPFSIIIIIIIIIIIQYLSEYHTKKDLLKC